MTEIGFGRSIPEPAGSPAENSSVLWARRDSLSLGSHVEFVPDLDGDGTPDLLCTLPLGGTVAIVSTRTWEPIWRFERPSIAGGSVATTVTSEHGFLVAIATSECAVILRPGADREVARFAGADAPHHGLRFERRPGSLSLVGTRGGFPSRKAGFDGFVRMDLAGSPARDLAEHDPRWRGSATDLCWLVDAAEPDDSILVERARIEQERGASAVLRAVRRSSGRELYRLHAGVLEDRFAWSVLAYPDLDGDACEDLLISTRSGWTDDFAPTPAAAAGGGARVELLSGRTGRSLRCFEFDPSIPNNAWATCLAGDVDRDGWPDVCTSALGEYRPGRLQLLSIVGERILWSIEGVPHEPWITLAFGSCLASGADVNRDGTLDIAVGAGEPSWDATGPMYGDPGAVFVTSGIDGSLISTVRGL